MIDVCTHCTHNERLGDACENSLCWGQHFAVESNLLLSVLMCFAAMATVAIPHCVLSRAPHNHTLLAIKDTLKLSLNCHAADDTK